MLKLNVSVGASALAAVLVASSSVTAVAAPAPQAYSYSLMAPIGKVVPMKKPASPQGWEPARQLPANFVVASPQPTVDDLNAIIHFLVATNASDEAKARNIQGGKLTVNAPKTVYRLGLFRAPKGWKRVNGPLHVNGAKASAHLTAGSMGRPTVSMRIQFIYEDQHWKLSLASICNGVEAVGLSVSCGA